jgi:hypothetical protein
MYYSLHGQDFNTMSGDWIRVRAEYKDGERIPSDHSARVIIRYHFAKKEMFQLFSGATLPSVYTRAGNALKIAPAQTFLIEEYSDKALTFVETDVPYPIRYYMIKTDSFQIMGRIKYQFEVIGADTIYTNAPGIEPIYPKGHNQFLSDVISGFTQQVGFKFSYVVQKDGTIGDVVVIVSTNPKLDKRLIQLIKKSSGKWIPATYMGELINVRQTESLGFSSNSERFTISR